MHSGTTQDMHSGTTQDMQCDDSGRTAMACREGLD
jgi:hypothetical protein